jgi:hypothetical protein
MAGPTAAETGRLIAGTIIIIVDHMCYDTRDRNSVPLQQRIRLKIGVKINDR